MNRDEVVATIQRYLGFRTGLTDVILSELSTAQRELELGQVKPWFIQSEYANITFIPGEERLALPPDFLLEVEEDGIMVRASPDDDFAGLYKGDIDNLVSVFGRKVGLPTSYALSGQYFRFYPTPDKAYEVKMLYYQRQPLLVSGTDENVWTLNSPDMLVGNAGTRVALQLRDTVAAGNLSALEARARAVVHGENEARKATNRTWQIGGPH